MATVTDIWRHPIKSHGAEPLEAVDLTAGLTMPWDRVWGVAHDSAKFKANGGWEPCVNFARIAKAPGLGAVRAKVDEQGGTVLLTHPERDPLTVNPDTDEGAAALVAWSATLAPPNRAQPFSVYRTDRGLTDSREPTISIASHASRRALSDRLQQDLSPLRFRINFWLEDGLAPFEEHDWVGKVITLGAVKVRVLEPIERCTATTANPETGLVDADTLGALEAGWGHRDLGVRAEVMTSGQVKIGDALTL